MHTCTSYSESSQTQSSLSSFFNFIHTERPVLSLHLQYIQKEYFRISISCSNWNSRYMQCQHGTHTVYVISNYQLYFPIYYHKSNHNNARSNHTHYSPLYASTKQSQFNIKYSPNRKFIQLVSNITNLVNKGCCTLYRHTCF